MAIVRPIVVDIGKTTVVGVTTIQTVVGLESMSVSFKTHCGSISLTTVFYSSSFALSASEETESRHVVSLYLNFAGDLRS